MLWKPLWKPEWKPESEHNQKRKRGTSRGGMGTFSLPQAQRRKNVGDDRRRENVDDSWYGVQQGGDGQKVVSSASDANDAREKASSYGRGSRPFYQDANGQREYLD